MSSAIQQQPQAQDLAAAETLASMCAVMVFTDRTTGVCHTDDDLQERTLHLLRLHQSRPWNR